MIFEFMINKAPQGSNSMNGREKYFKTINFKIQIVQWSHGPVVCGLTFCAGGSSGADSNSGKATSSFVFGFFLLSHFYPLTCFRSATFILTADPF